MIFYLNYKQLKIILKMSLEILSNPVVIWFLIGLFFLLLELAIPGLIVVFFGVGAWVTALITAIFHPGINMQIILFVVVSVVLLLLLRKYVKRTFFGKSESVQDELADEFIGKNATAESDMSAGSEGKVSFNGTLWKAIAETDVKTGDKVKIVSRDNITLKVKSNN